MCRKRAGLGGEPIRPSGRTLLIGLGNLEGMATIIGGRVSPVRCRFVEGESYAPQRAVCGDLVSALEINSAGRTLRREIRFLRSGSDPDLIGN